MDKISLFTKTAAEAYAAGRHDSRHFIALYKAYLRGASDAVELIRNTSMTTVLKWLWQL